MTNEYLLHESNYTASLSVIKGLKKLGYKANIYAPQTILIDSIASDLINAVLILAKKNNIEVQNLSQGLRVTELKFKIK